MTYHLRQTSCGCDDLYLVINPKGRIIEAIVFWDDEPEWMERATKKAERICRWLNRRPPLRVRLNRILRGFNPTGNHPAWSTLSEVADHLYDDWEPGDFTVSTVWEGEAA